MHCVQLVASAYQALQYTSLGGGGVGVQQTINMESFVLSKSTELIIKCNTGNWPYFAIKKCRFLGMRENLKC